MAEFERLRFVGAVVNGALRPRNFLNVGLVEPGDVLTIKPDTEVKEMPCILDGQRIVTRSYAMNLIQDFPMEFEVDRRMPGVKVLERPVMGVTKAVEKAPADKMVKPEQVKKKRGWPKGRPRKATAKATPTGRQEEPVESDPVAGPEVDLPICLPDRQAGQAAGEGDKEFGDSWKRRR